LFGLKRRRGKLNFCDESWQFKLNAFIFDAGKKYFKENVQM